MAQKRFFLTLGMNNVGQTVRPIRKIKSCAAFPAKIFEREAFPAKIFEHEAFLNKILFLQS